METAKQLSGHATAARGFAHLFGLDIRAAALAVIVDLMANSAEIVTMGLFTPVEVLAGVALIFIVFKIQRAWYGDDRDSALIKGLIVGLLTAIPVATTPFLLAYAGVGTVVGFFSRPRRTEVIEHEPR